MKLILIFTYFAASVVANETGLKAASGQVNCNCQCSSYTFRDGQGVVHGNCRTSDRGARWCYVDRQFSSCSDLQPSTRSPGRYWSYEGCATPSRGSLQCSYNNYGNGYNNNNNQGNGYNSNYGYSNNYGNGYNSGYNNNLGSGYNSNGYNTGFNNNNIGSGYNNGYNNNNIGSNYNLGQLLGGYRSSSNTKSEVVKF